MTDNGTDWFVVYSEDPHLSEYTAKCDRYREALSGFTGSAGVLVIGPEESLLFTDSRYYVQGEKQLEGTGIKLMRYGMPRVPSCEEYLADHLWEGQRLAVSFKTVSFARYRDLLSKLPESVELVDGEKMLKEAIGELLGHRNFEAVLEMPEEAAGKSTEDKIASIRQKIAKKYPNAGSYTYILSDLTDIMYLFNLRGCDILHVPVAYSYALITGCSATLYISRKNLGTETEKKLEDIGITIREYSCFYKDLDDIATDIVIADAFKNNAAILKRFDEDGIFADCHDPSVIGKAVKNKAEISGMRSAHIKDAVVMIKFIRSVKEMAKEGKLHDEYELGRMLDDARIGNGCSDLSFDTICAYAQNSAIVHYTAGKDTARSVSAPGFLLVDSGGQYRFEGTTDITRTISLGEVSKEEKKVYTTVLKGNLRLMDMIFPEGYKGALLDTVAESPLWETGYFCGHGIGHGVGHYLSVHESEARISRAESERETPFFPGVIVSDEPGIYIEGRFGVRLENLLLTVKSDDIDGHKMCAFEPLTLVPFDKESTDLSDLSEKEMFILKKYNSLIWEKISPLLDEEDRLWLKENIDID